MALTSLARTCLHHLPTERISQLIETGNHIQLKQFSGSLPSILINGIASTDSFTVCVLPDFESARFFEADIQELGSEQVFFFPPTFQHPYDKTQLHETSALVERSEVLHQISQAKGGIIVTSADALFYNVPSPEDFKKQTLTIEKASQFPLEELIDQIIDLGYNRESFVEAPGEFSQRGGILDIYPFNSQYPVRIEFWGDEIDSIREFDPDSQRSVAFLDITRLVPNVEGLVNADAKPLFSYLPEKPVLYLQNETFIRQTLDDLLTEGTKRYENQKEEDDFKHPEEFFFTYKQFSEYISDKAVIYQGLTDNAFSDEKVVTLNASPQPEMNASIKLLRRDIASLSKKSYDVEILCDNEAQKDRFEELLGDPGPVTRYSTQLATLHEGFQLHDAGLAVYTDHQIFNRYHRPKSKTKVSHKRGGLSMKEIQDLNVGDYVVHVDYGIGKFMGFRRIKVKDVMQESVMLEYQKGSTLFVNVSSLHKLQKYSGKDGVAPKVTKLGSGEWARKKSKTKSKLKDIARDLIELYAKRKSQEAFQFSPDTKWQTELEASFMFEETPDQMKAIDDVKADMMTDFPMDRLVCGDVGFGKTEVAVRAAFKAINDGKQVAVLVPTTILADQHFKTFSERMKNFPVRVDVISRFRTAQEQKKIVEDTKKGKIDILIGTHRITSKDINFRDLGLMIIDEEQRFGVSIKERLKKYRATVDVLTLSATPIPRTLHMSLMGARDLSTINTPPPNRQPVLTEIHSFNEEIIRDAIMQEVARGGQVFFIHNRVQNMSVFTEMIRKVVPNVRIRSAHGQMSGKELEKIIGDFYLHKFDVLISTNIVENGIDISNANTMIINQAQNFGLAELHQLRGRVGRSNRKAFCYLITPPFEDLSVDSRKRLMALEEYSDLGSGFNIAMRDLDIRGAGDVLGAEQSGFINELGFDLYNKILNDAIKELKETEYSGVFDDVETPEETPDTVIEIDLEAIINNDYVEDDVERLNLYRRIARAKTDQEIDEWVEEVKDRFGPIPHSVQNLITVARIRLYASSRYIEKVTIRADRMWLQCPSNKKESGEKFYEDGRFKKLFEEIQKKAGDRLQLIQKEHLVRFMIKEIPDLEAARSFLKELFNESITAHELI